MNILLKISMVLLILNLSNYQLFSQIDTIENEGRWLIETIDGKKFYGHIKYRAKDKINIYTDSLGLVSIQSDRIKSMGSIQDDYQIKESIHDNRPTLRDYYFMDNSFSLSKGKAQYKNIWFFYNQIEYGISDKFDIGLLIFPIIFYEVHFIGFFKMKYSFYKEDRDLNFAIKYYTGNLIGGTHNLNNLIYGLMTLGTQKNNINFGLGWGFSYEGFGNEPTFNLSGAFSISDKLQVMFDSHTIGYDEFLGLLGFRKLVKRSSWDLGAIVSPKGSTINVLPWIGINYEF